MCEVFALYITSKVKTRVHTVHDSVNDLNHYRNIVTISVHGLLTNQTFLWVLTYLKKMINQHECSNI